MNRVKAEKREVSKKHRCISGFSSGLFKNIDEAQQNSTERPN
tara:strand:+ start:393 stop:518 length:126 start_codon:yes stop_codon:yes gene_type:complete